MIQDRKYVDADVTPDLLGRAVAYAVEYTGTFGYMLDAQMLALSTGSLPPGVARGVLNCMRTDPRVALEAPLPPNVTPLRSVRPSPAEDFEDDEPEDRRIIMDFPVTIKRRFGVARSGGTVMHVPEPQATLRWSNADMSGREWVFHEPRPEALYVRWLCGARTVNPYLVPTYEPAEDKPCRRCFEIAEITP